MQITSWFTEQQRSWPLALLAGVALIAFFGCKSTAKNTPEAALTEGCARLLATIRAEVDDPQRADRASRIALELQARERAFLDSSKAIKSRFFELNRDPEATRAALEWPVPRSSGSTVEPDGLIPWRGVERARRVAGADVCGQGRPDFV